MAFRVLPRLSYAAIRELRRELKLKHEQEKLSQQGKSEKKMTDEQKKQEIQRLLAQHEKLQSLKKRVLVNRINNVKFVKDLFGRKVTYGTAIQLQHVDSGYFLQHAKRSSADNHGCSAVELVEEPSPQRVTFFIHSRYKYRQLGDEIVFGDHILLYNIKYNQYLSVSEERRYDQKIRNFPVSEFRPPSPLRRPNLEGCYRRFEVNKSQMYYKWEVLSFRQPAKKEKDLFLYSGDIIYLKHAETSGLMCFDQQSYKNQGNPVYVRIFKGMDETERYTTNSLFEIQIFQKNYVENISKKGEKIYWRDYKTGDLKQTVIFRHLNSGKLLTVSQIEVDSQNEKSAIASAPQSQKQSPRQNSEKKVQYVLTLSDGISIEEMNERIDRICEIQYQNRNNFEFNPQLDPELSQLYQGCDLSQVFEIENTIIEQQPFIKNFSVVKIMNLKYHLFISTEIKNLAGGQDEKDADKAEDESENLEDLSQLGKDDESASKIQEQLQIQKTAGTQNEEVSDKGGKFAKMIVDESENIILNMTVMAPNAQMDDVYSIEKFSFVEVQKLFFIYSCVPYIKEFIYNLRIEQENLNSPYMKSIEELLSKMCLFLLETDGTDAFTCDGNPIKANQNYFRELKIIDLLVDILIYAFEGENAPFIIKKLTQKSPIIRICQLIYRILKFCAKDNELNKFYVAQWISHFFDQSMMTNENNNLMAETTITELVTNNRTLLDKQINRTTIQNIIKICSDNEKNKRFIDLLSELCSCNGFAIPSNQDDVCDILLEDDEFSHMLIKVESADESNQHLAIFNDMQVIQTNNGEPIVVAIDEMFNYFSARNDLRLYNYFNSMLRLTSLMCLSRNYKGIIKLQELYSQDFVIDCFLNEDIGYSIRANLARMLLTIHIDKDPLANVNVPVLTRVWADVTNAKNVKIPSSRVKIPQKLLKLKDYVVKYFEELDGTCRLQSLDQNLFSLQVLFIIEKMLQLGFYQNDKEILNIVMPLVALLDTSNDFYSREEEEGYMIFIQSDRKKGDNEFKRDKSVRNKISEAHLVIISIKIKIIDILHRVMDLQNDIRLARMLSEFAKQDKKLMNDAVIGSAELRYLNNLLIDEQTDEEIQSLKERVDKKTIEQMKKSYSNKDLDLRFKRSKIDLICILLDIILFSDTTLVNKAFTLLTRYFTQKSAIIQNTSDVQILQEQQEVAILHKVRDVLVNMKKESENAEFWMGSPEYEDMKRSRTFIDQLEMLTDLCNFNPDRVVDIDEKKKKDDIDVEDLEDGSDGFEFLNFTELFNEWDNEDQKICSEDDIMDEKNQRLLRNLRAHDLAVIIIRQQGLEGASDKNVYLKVLEKCYIFLIKFVKNNSENQMVLIEYIDLFMDDLEYGVHAWELIAEIFSNSSLLVSFNIIPYLKKVIKIIDQLPKETQKKTTMLSFLIQFMKYNGQPRRDLQTFICLELTSIVRKNCQHLFVGEMGLKDLHLYILEMKNAYQEFTSDDKFLPEIAIPPELSFTIEYIKILAFTAEGKNGITETRCQEKFPVLDILENMKLADFCYPLKSALVYYMDAVYFDIEKDISDENIKRFFNFINIISVDLERFLDIQVRQKQNQPIAKNAPKKPKNQAGDSDNQNDLEGVFVDINKNFTVKTSFGSFPILYLIEKYIFEVVFLALQNFFQLSLPIQFQQQDFYRKFLQNILRSANFAVKDQHKAIARDLFKTIKQISALKDLGGSSMNSRNILVPEKKTQVGAIGLPSISQAQKLKALMKSVQTSDFLQEEFEKEFQDLIYYVTEIHIRTQERFNGTLNIQVRDILAAMIKISDIDSDIDKNLRVICLKVIRKVVEQENKGKTTPASQWESEDWSNFSTEIKIQQNMLLGLGVVKLLCNIISYEEKLSIKEEALLVSIAILLGGNYQTQIAFNNYIIRDQQNKFMKAIKEMVQESFEIIKTTQIQRNEAKRRIIQLENIIQDLEQLQNQSNKLSKQNLEDLKKARADKRMLEEEIPETDYNSDENPANYNTNDLTVARAFNDLTLLMKMHQLFCENHNQTLQNTLRQQNTEEGKVKVNSIDFVSLYSRMFQDFQNILNNNTSEVAHQLVETLTECIQGPCKGNQRVMVYSKIFDSSREFIAGFQLPSDVCYLGFEEKEDFESLEEFKQKIVTMLTSLLEGEFDMEIMQRMSFSLDMSVMKERMVNVYRKFAEELLGEENIDLTELTINRLNNYLEKNSFDGNIGEAFQIYILMYSLADTIKEQEINLEKNKFTAEQWRAFEFIRSHTGRIEINVNNSLQRVYFPVKPVCSYMSEGVKKQLMNEVDRSSQNAKVSALMEAVPDLIDEMYHNEELSRATLQITPQRLAVIQDLSTLICCLINFLYLSFTYKKFHYMQLDSAEWTVSAISILGYLQLVSSLVLIFFFSINKKQLITNKAWREFVDANQELFQLLPNNERLSIDEMSIEMTHVILMLKGPNATDFNNEGVFNLGNWFTKLEYYILNMYFFIQDSTFQYYILYFGISLLGFLSSDIYYSLHLLDIINRFPTLQNVIKSITENYEQLTLTFMLMCILVYIHTLFTFLYLQDTMYDYSINSNDNQYVGENKCLTVFECFLVFCNDGLKPDGGIQEFSEPVDYISDMEHYLVKLSHDLSYVIIIKIILFSIIFGIIIDTFAQLRCQKAENDHDMINICFICGLYRLVFDKYSEGGMERHIAKDHNLWMYVFYLLHLKTKDSSDRNGIESYVVEKYEQKDYSWVPRLKALCILNYVEEKESQDGAEEESEGGPENEQENKEKEQEILQHFNEKIKLINRRLQNFLEKVELITQQEKVDQNI